MKLDLFQIGKGCSLVEDQSPVPTWIVTGRVEEVEYFVVA